jgi:hypothetical protein|nr:MAG TPA: Protein of unknown function (DUF551) [Caudoviricetes sp.]
MEKHIDDINAETLERIYTQPSACHWTPVSRALPDKLIPVLITYVNRNPAPYYQDIKDKPDVAAAYYHKGKWWWYSSVCEDYLSEYGQSPPDEIDAGIEVIAWRPFPKPYKEKQQ